MRQFLSILLFLAITLGVCRDAASEGVLSWPIACVPGLSCLSEARDSGIGYPDIGTNSDTFQCRAPAYKGHTGTDIYVASVDSNIAVTASANGQVMWVKDGMFDRCPNQDEPDCKPRITPICSASAGSWGSDRTISCDGTSCDCLWGFNAGNFVLIRHDDIHGIAFTLYAHLKKGSITVSHGQNVHQGDQIGMVGSSGNALRPHLHFGVWRTMVGSLELANPWGRKCNSDSHYSLWYSDPPFMANLPTITKHSNVPSKFSRVSK